MGLDTRNKMCLYELQSVKISQSENAEGEKCFEKKGVVSELILQQGMRWANYRLGVHLSKSSYSHIIGQKK